MAYSELIKSFERIRDYMREFFVYGFKSRGEYSLKSARSYDNERRRVESWLGDAMSFRQTENGKNVFISVDVREMEHNPLFAAFKAKSFTDKDITLFFYTLDILQDGKKRTVSEIQEFMNDRYLYPSGSDMDFDLSTLRKKLKEYEELGLITGEKEGSRLLYSISSSGELDRIIGENLSNAVEFFSEEAPLGVIGSFISEREVNGPAGSGTVRFSHKHHYILDVLDSEVMLELLRAIRGQRVVEIQAVSREGRGFVWNIVPLKIFVSTQLGRYYLIGYSITLDGFDTIRIDHIHSIRIREKYAGYADVMARYMRFRKNLWGVAFNRHDRTQHVEMDVCVNKGEEHIIGRLQREARCGRVLQVDEHTWRYEADVYDTLEMLPWIRTFTGRITRLASTDGELEERFYEDLGAMKRMYEGMYPEMNPVDQGMNPTGAEMHPEAEGGVGDAVS